MREKYVLYLYSAAAFRQVVLPAVNNADYVIQLSAGQFCFREEVRLFLEVIENIWYLNWEEERQLLCDGDFLKLRLERGEVLSLFCRVESSVFCAGNKYALDGSSPVTIGSAPENMISYNVFQLVSAYHALMIPVKEGYSIVDKSKNGIYINGKRISDETRLHFGDCIDLFGLRVVFLKEAVAVFGHAGEGAVRVRLRQPVLKEFPGILMTGVQKQEGRCFHRRPRRWREPGEDGSDVVEIEAPAAKREEERQSSLLTLGPASTFVLPMVISAVIGSRRGDREGGYLYTGLFMTAGAAFLGVFWGLANWFFRRKEKKWEEKRRKTVYKNYLREMEEYIAEKHRRERDILLERYPLYAPPLVWEEMVVRLWNRNMEQKDFLCQRVGLGEAEFSLEIRVPKTTVTMFRDDLREEPGRLRKKYEKLQEIPFCIDLERHRVIGIAGGRGREEAVRVAACLLLQIAVNNCYTDVKIAYLYDEADVEMNKLAGLVKWLPHIWSENRRMRYLAGNRAEAGEILHTLGEICRNPMKKHYVVMIADQSILDGESFQRYIFLREAGVRLTTVFLEEGIDDMPNGCGCFLQNDSYFSGFLCGSEEKKLMYDRMPMSYGEEVARKLSGVRVKENGTAEELKEYVPFLSLFPETKPEDMDIAGKWRKSRIQESIRVPVGEMAGGRLLYLDAHEKYHGPHGLIAGTTGSGKSETLQTYLLSLAMHFGPEDIAFFIIDYKGGGMGNLFGELPHTVGTVSNLSGNQIGRALISIKSENEKRQRQFQNCGVSHINQYTVAFQNHKAAECMPHLFIIVDEFAELKREEPEFMKELVSVAQVGRSLGIHLILSTQKPAGVVDDHIWSNTRFRLCLRVQDRQDSMDMLHKPDAAGLTGAGRCYLQVGNDEIFELFQAAYGGAAYEENSREAKKESRMITRTGRDVFENTGSRLRYDREQNQKHNQEENQEKKQNQKEIQSQIERQKQTEDQHQEESQHQIKEQNQIESQHQIKGQSQIEKQDHRKEIKMTQSEKILDYLKRLGAEMGYTGGSKMWMPLLPDVLNLDALEHTADSGMKTEKAPGELRQLSALIGLCDHPAGQKQYPLTFDLFRQGNVLICGGPATGKSTLLQTLLYSLMKGYSPAEAEFYLIDCSLGMLRSFREMPHVAGTAGEEEEQWERIFYRLRQEFRKRKARFAGGSFLHMQAEERIPAILLAIDHYGGFRLQSGEKYDELIQRLAAEGKNNGIFLIFTASGIGIGEVPGKLAGNFGCRLCLEMGDPYQYGEILKVGRTGIYPEAGKRGRGIVKAEEGVLEFQTALVSGEQNDFIRMEKIAEKSEEFREKYFPHAAKAIPVIPEVPDFALFYRQVLEHESSVTEGSIPIGYEQESGHIYEIVLKNCYCFLITGKKGSGKSNLLRIICRMAVKKAEKVMEAEKVVRTVKEEQRAEVVWIDFSGECDYEEIQCVRMISSDGELYRWLEEFSPVMQERNRRIHEGERDGFLPVYVMIDDLADFCRHIRQPAEGMESMEAFVEHIWKKGSGHGLYWFAGWNQEAEAGLAGFSVSQTFTGYGTGLHLGGNAAAQRHFDFSDLTYGEQNRVMKPGRGLVPPGETAGTVRIILPYVGD